MNDLISRQAAIDLFPNDALEWDTNGGYIAPHLVRRMIEELPPAQPIRNGRWMEIIEVNELGDVYQSGVYCSECGHTDSYEPNYCPNCGARMEENYE